MKATQENAVKISRVYLDLEGLAMFLGGELQAVVYAVVLAKPGATIKDMHEYINQNYQDIKASTVSTIANKLVDKNVFQRVDDGIGERAKYRYTALVDYDALVEIAITQVIAKIRKQHPGPLQEVIYGAL